MTPLYRISHGIYSSRQNFPSAMTSSSEPPVVVPLQMESPAAFCSLKSIIRLRAQAAFLSYEQLDLVILVSVMATINSDKLYRPWHRHKPARKQKTMMTYRHHGHYLCKQVDVLPSKNQALCDLIYNVIINGYVT